MIDQRPGFADIWLRDRAYVTDVAFRMLGNIHDAEDVVQEAFRRLLDSDVDEILDVRGWLVVVVSRICLDQLRSAHHRREAVTGAGDELPLPTGVAVSTIPTDPADRVTLDDTVRMAMLVVLEQLRPAERTVFVLRDVFQFSFDAIAGIVGRTPAACRQLASRARRRLESETQPSRFSPDLVQQHQVAREFIEACAGGDLDALLRLLDADVSGVVDLGNGPSARPFRGRATIGRRLLAMFGPQSGATLVSQPVNGEPGVLAFLDGRLEGIIRFGLSGGLITEIHALADPVTLAFADRHLAGGGEPEPTG